MNRAKTILISVIVVILSVLAVFLAWGRNGKFGMSPTTSLTVTQADQLTTVYTDTLSVTSTLGTVYGNTVGSPSVSSTLGTVYSNTIGVPSVSSTLGTVNTTVNSVSSTLQLVDEHMHSQSRVSPSLAPGITITDGASPWILGNLAVLMESGSSTGPFDIHAINLANVSANDTYEMVLYTSSTVLTEIGRTRFSRGGANTNNSSRVEFQTVIVPANSIIVGKVASQTGGNSVTTSVIYHQY